MMAREEVGDISPPQACAIVSAMASVEVREG
jgi:hypothetical protein